LNIVCFQSILIHRRHLVISGIWDIPSHTNHAHMPRSHAQRPGPSFGIRMDQIYPRRLHHAIKTSKMNILFHQFFYSQLILFTD